MGELTDGNHVEAIKLGYGADPELVVGRKDYEQDQVSRSTVAVCSCFYGHMANLP